MYFHWSQAAQINNLKYWEQSGQQSSTLAAKLVNMEMESSSSKWLLVQLACAAATSNRCLPQVKETFFLWGSVSDVLPGCLLLLQRK